jgi:hypothetical protein
MIAAVVSLALQEAPVPIVTVTASRGFPSAIREQVRRYSTCVSDSTNASLHAAGGVSEASRIRQIAEQARRDCAALRETLAAESDRALAKDGWSERKRQAAVEDAFADAGREGDRLADRIDQMTPAGARPAAPAAGAPVALATREDPIGGLHIPDEIAPAIVPYMTCQLQSHGVRIGPPGAQAVQSPQQQGMDCSVVRKRAAQQAERLLDRQGRGSARERRAFVERVLANADAFVAQAAAPPSASPGTSHAPHQ